MINLLFSLFRFTILAFSLPFSWLLCAILYPLIPLNKWAYIVRAWAYFVLWVNGVNLKIYGNHKPKYLPANTMVIANHMTWLDIVTLYCISFISFVGKTEMRKWPILSTMIRAGGTIFINRSNKRDLIKINSSISKELTNGKCIGFFPEGSVNTGRTLLPFKTSLFESAILAKSTIIPIVLLYYKKDGTFAYEASYANCNLLQNITKILKLNGLSIKAIILDPVNAGDFVSRDQLAHYLYQQIEQIYQKRDQSN